MSRLDQLERGRESFRQQAWMDAYEQLTAADREGPLEPSDLLHLAMAAYLIGRDGESISILTRAHQDFLSRDDKLGAIRCTFWIGYHLINTGDMAQAGGWFGRGRTILSEFEGDCVERGYLVVPIALQNLFGGENSKAYELFTEAVEIGRRFGDVDLITLAGLGQGQALIGLGEVAKGVARLDEVMVAVSAGEASAIVGGLVYCAVIGACQEIFDLRRAQEWTTALTDWCASQPDLVPYRGQCLVHRSELMQFHGEWPNALTEAERAREQLAQAPDQASIGMAFYQLAEIHRLQGDFGEAEEAYRQGNQWGRTPQPGLALLRLAQGRIEAAQAAVRVALDEDQYHAGRSKVLPAFIEIALTAGDTAGARDAVEEFSRIAADLGAPFLLATADHAEGSVLLSEGDAQGALGVLRRAWKRWQELEAPYESARTRVLIGLAARALGDEDTASMELEAARWAFEQLGAEPDLARVEGLSPTEATREAGGLTGREVEVLALVAAGKTNRQIAADLVISEKTVARHVSNIFTKLGVSSRSAATAYAYEHDLV